VDAAAINVNAPSVRPCELKLERRSEAPYLKIRDSRDDRERVHPSWASGPNYSQLPRSSQQQKRQRESRLNVARVFADGEIKIRSGRGEGMIRKGSRDRWKLE